MTIEEQEFPEGIINFSGLGYGNKLVYSKYGKNSFMRTVFLQYQDSYNNEVPLFFLLENKLFFLNMGGVDYPKTFWSICDTIHEFDFNIVLYFEFIETIMSKDEFKTILLSVTNPKQDDFDCKIKNHIGFIKKLASKYLEGDL